MRRPHRQIEVFDISLMAVVTKAMGAFLVLMLILIPYYPTGPNVEQTVEDAQSKVEDAKANVKEATKAAEAGNIAELKRQLSDAKTKVDVMEKEQKKLAQNAEFTKMLTEFKAVEAQREAYMSGDFKKFAELAQPLNTGAKGTGATGSGGKADPQDEILDRATKLAESKKMPIREAIAQVLADDPELAAKANK